MTSMPDNEVNQSKRRWIAIQNNEQLRREALAGVSSNQLSSWAQTHPDLYRLVASIARAARFKLPSHRKRR